MDEDQLEFPQMLPEERAILNSAIELRKENPKLSAVEALEKAFEAIGTTKKDHLQMYIRLAAMVEPEEKRLRYEASRPDLHN